MRTMIDSKDVQPTNPLLDLNVDGTFNNENGHVRDFISLLGSGSKSDIAALLSHTEEMSEENITSLMFAASFPSVSAEVFNRVVDAVLRWGDRFHGIERQRFYRALFEIPDDCQG